MLFDLMKGKQAHPLSYKIRSLSTDQADFEVLPAIRYYQRIREYICIRQLLAFPQLKYTLNIHYLFPSNRSTEN